MGVVLAGGGVAAIEAARQPLAPMQASFLRVGDRLGAGDADRVAFDLDLEIRLLDTWDFRDDDEIVAFSEHIDRRIGTGTAGTGLEPTARSECIQRLLQVEQRLEWIG